MSRQIIETFEEQFHETKGLCDRAMAQVADGGLHAKINPLQNSIASIVQHLAGNLRSRWTDFLASDGEKPDRNRDGEFPDRQLPREELMALWEIAWKCLFDSLAALTDADLQRIVTIRNEPHTVHRAIVRAIDHCAWHAGQIALIAKHLTGDAWQYLTIPPGGSGAFNQKMGAK
jgi:Protein of unknown function (DUF1572)